MTRWTQKRGTVGITFPLVPLPIGVSIGISRRGAIAIGIGLRRALR